MRSTVHRLYVGDDWSDAVPVSKVDDLAVGLVGRLCLSIPGRCGTSRARLDELHENAVNGLELREVDPTPEVKPDHGRGQGVWEHRLDDLAIGVLVERVRWIRRTHQPSPQRTSHQIRSSQAY